MSPQRHRPRAVLLAAALLMITLSACSAGSDSTAPPDVTPSPTSDLGDAFAERDRFFADQGFAGGATRLAATTPAQQDFIAQQRAYVESQGAPWSADSETVALALTADACETSILNGHDVNAADVTAHVQSSPLIAALLEGLSDEQRAAGVENLTSIAVFGTGFLCPADQPQWQAAFAEVFG